MIQLCPNDRCNGCEACANICPFEAITMKADKHGFFHPCVDEDKCVDCGSCKKVCSVENASAYREPIKSVYAAWNQNQDIRLKSSSGGVFTLLSEKILDSGGVVYGAAFDNNHIHHIRIDSRAEVEKLRGSKYVQSRINDVYKQIRSDLKKGINVLFSGTPCQVSGLKNYLGKDYLNLLCIDVICHGVPSPMVFGDYINYLESKYKSSVRSISFRYKKPGWTVFSMKTDFENGATYVKSKFKDPYLYFFSSGGAI